MPELQLVGATALYIASKLYESNLVSAEVFSYSSSGVFSAEQLFKKEEEMLLSLNFKTDYPDALRFLKVLRTHEGLE